MRKDLRTSVHTRGSSASSSSGPPLCQPDRRPLPDHLLLPNHLHRHLPNHLPLPDRLHLPNHLHRHLPNRRHRHLPNRRHRHLPNPHLLRPPNPHRHRLSEARVTTATLLGASILTAQITSAFSRAPVLQILRYRVHARIPYAA
eukprot:jgi/Botrbrau1/1301/Bobra.0063s0018.1